MRTELLVLIGAGGHAKVVYDAWTAGRPGAAVRILDEDRQKCGQAFLDLRIEAPAAWEEFGGMSFHVAVGDNSARRKLVHRAVAAGLVNRSVFHPTAYSARSTEIGSGCFLAAHAIIAAGATVAEGCIINHGAIVDHENTIGAFCHVAPGAVLGGAVRIGIGVLVGASATILPGRNVGDYATIGAGAVVTRDVPPHSTVVGNPARPISLQ